MRPQPWEGSSGVVRAAVRRRAGCQARNGVTLGSAIARSASDPALLQFQPGTDGCSCEGGSWCLSVGGGFSRAAHGAPVLVAVHVVGPRCAAGAAGGQLLRLRRRWPRPRKTGGSVLLAPARWVVVGVVAHQRVGDAGGAPPASPTRWCATTPTTTHRAGAKSTDPPVFLGLGHRRRRRRSCPPAAPAAQRGPTTWTATSTGAPCAARENPPPTERHQLPPSQLQPSVPGWN